MHSLVLEHRLFDREFLLERTNAPYLVGPDGGVTSLGGSGFEGGTMTVGGGVMPISRAAGSAPSDSTAGVSSVTHSGVDDVPLAGRVLTLVAMLSCSTTALPLASWPVTTRRKLVGMEVLPRCLRLR